MRLGLFALAFLAAAAAPSAAQQLQRDVLAGHVTSASGAVAGALVSVTNAHAPAGSAPVTARADGEGRWLLAMQDGSGNYVVRVTAIGMTPVQVTATRGEPRKPIVVDVQLQASVVALNAVKVTEQRRQRAPREDLPQDRAGNQADRESDSFGGAIAAADQGNLAAMAASVPGVTLVPDGSGGVAGFSVLGMSADQNRVTMNGLSFGGGDLPRDAVAGVRVTPITYDVSRGGFSGGQLSVTTFGGGNYHQRLLHATVDAPSLQFTDPVGRTLGTQYTNAQFSGSALGPIAFNRAFYNVSFQAGRRTSDLRSLATADPLALERVGVAQDSVARAVGALSSLGIPTTAGGIPGARVTENGSLLARIDVISTPTSGPPDRAAYLLASVRHSKSMGSFLTPTALPAHGGDLTGDGADVSGVFSAYFHNNMLEEVRAGAHVNHTSATPYLALPDAHVLVGSTFADSSAGTAMLLLGGNPALPRDARTSGAEVYNGLSWFSLDHTHHWRITADARDDAFSQSQYGNTLGTFTYNSLADLGANRPSSFTRSFINSSASASALTQALSIGDDWRPVSRATIIYGVRLDANEFLNHAAYDSAVAQRFHARTDFAPSLADLSPRVGFFRQFGYNGTTGIPGFGSPRGNVHGGIGLFRNDVSPTLIAPALLASGAATDVRQIACVGAAVPVPDWSSYASAGGTIPTSCADTAESSPFASTQPNVWMVDPKFHAQRAWRGSLGINTFLIPKLVRFGLEGIYSLNLNQQAPVDLNFAPTAHFSLPAEGNRPVFTAPSSVVQSTGSLTNRDSRLDPAFGGVSMLRSDLQSRSRQVVLTIYPAPGDALGRFTQWQLSYAYQQMRDESRGFTGTTAGDPLDVTWSRGAQDFRHQATLSFSTRVASIFSVATTARVQSGTPYTPTVNADINGDGYANDRAFVFNPADVDSNMARGMSALLAGAPARVRDCLRRQLGTIAGRNSCEGPWTATMNAVFLLNPELFRWNNRAQVSVSLTNVPAGLDELVHGSSRLQGWGQSAASDPTLLYVRGFNADTRRYTYDVNPRFGDTRVSRSGVRNPFLITVEARFQLGEPVLDQTVDQVLAPGRSRRGERLTPQQMRNRLMNGVFNAVHGLLQAKDSLSYLSDEQLKALTALDRRVSVKGDSIIAPVVEYLAALPQTYDHAMVAQRVLAAEIALFDIAVDGMQDARKIFTAEQIDEFPPALRSAFDIERLKTLRPAAGFTPDY